MPLEFWTLRLVYTEPPALAVRGLGFPTRGLVPQGAPALSCDSLYSLVCLSNYGGSGLPYDLTSLMDLRRHVAFSVSSAFYLLGESVDFRDPHIQDWKF